MWILLCMLNSHVDIWCMLLIYRYISVVSTFTAMSHCSTVFKNVQLAYIVMMCRFYLNMQIDSSALVSEKTSGP